MSVRFMSAVSFGRVTDNVEVFVFVAEFGKPQTSPCTKLIDRCS